METPKTAPPEANPDTSPTAALATVTALGGLMAATALASTPGGGRPFERNAPSPRKTAKDEHTRRMKQRKAAIEATTNPGRVYDDYRNDPRLKEPLIRKRFSNRRQIKNARTAHRQIKHRGKATASSLVLSGRVESLSQFSDAGKTSLGAGRNIKQPARRIIPVHKVPDGPHKGTEAVFLGRKKQLVRFDDIDVETLVSKRFYKQLKAGNKMPRSRRTAIKKAQKRGRKHLKKVR